MESYRSLFPVVGRYIYLNHAANSPEPLPVLSAMQEYMRACSDHGTAMEDHWKHKPARARANFAKLLDCKTRDIAFLPNVSSAANLVAGGLDWRPGDNVVITQDQFPANVYPWLFLQSAGVEVRFADWQKHGFIDSIYNVVDSKTRVVAVSWVEYFSGNRHNLADVGILCKNMGIILFVDAIQGLGALTLRQADTGADIIAVGGHKWLLGPEGQGAAYFSPQLIDRLHPPAFSWRSIEDFMNFDSYRLDLRSDAARYEAGTQNWAGVLGFGAGLELILQVGPGIIASKIEDLTTQLLIALSQMPVDLLTPAPWKERAGIITLRPRYLDADFLRLKLLSRGIVCSTRRGALRISPHFYNTQQEIDTFVNALVEILR